ncbi:threonine/serine exporter family protein [Lachnoclostridium sp.]|uniref:threonine/serine exporter family protein n=1 Tax=Lachnoclostridium sp. TaxID=2028282 RepID=UPI00289F4288|nr:threonine/serine exporter family protein [Lachnoclostridium sp.]
MIVQIIGAFIAVLTLALAFGVPRKFLVYSAIVGAIDWLVYLISLGRGLSLAMSVFVATLVIAFISHAFARRFKAPVTVFLIPGILPLVPGVGTYRIVYYLILEDGAKASYYFYQTLQIAGMIAIGIFIMDTFFKFFQKPLSVVGKEAENIELQGSDSVEDSTGHVLEEEEKRMEQDLLARAEALRKKMKEREKDDLGL